MKMVMATIGLKFDSTKPINELNIPLPEGSQILSVATISDDSTLNINFMANREIFASDLWREYEFVMCKCNYTEFEIDEYKYIGNINFENNAFTVFFKKGLILA